MLQSATMIFYKKKNLRTKQALDVTDLDRQAYN
jgi:hypothetical protein